MKARGCSNKRDIAACWYVYIIDVGDSHHAESSNNEMYYVPTQS